MNFKTPFKVLTTAALIGTLSLSAVAPGAASAANATTAQSVKSETADHAVDYVVLVNSKGELGKLSFDEYVALEIKGEEALISALGDFTIKYIVTGNGNVYDLNDLAEEEIKSQGKDVPASELLKNLDDKDAELDAKVIEDAKETKIEDGKVVIDETAEDFKVTEIAAITQTIAGDKDEVALKFQLNGEKEVTAADLIKEGYTVEFKFNKTAPTGEAGKKAKEQGIVNTKVAPFNTDFTYAVEVTDKDGNKIGDATEFKKVTVTDATKAVSVDGVKLVKGEETPEFVTVDEEGVTFAATGAKNAFNEALKTVPAVESVTALNTDIAYYKNDVIVPRAEGTAKFEVKFEGIEAPVTYELTVKAAAKIASVKETSLKVAKSAPVTLSLLNQHGAPIAAKSADDLKVKIDSADAVSATVTTAGKITVPAFETTGDHKVVVLDKDGNELGTVAITVVDASKAVADSYKFVEADATKEKDLDVTVGADAETTVQAKIFTLKGIANEVELADLKETLAALNKENVSTEGKFVVESSDQKVAEVDGTTTENKGILDLAAANPLITVNAVNKGTATIKVSYVTGSVKKAIASFDVTVKNETPQYTQENVTLKDAKDVAVADDAKIAEALVAGLEYDKKAINAASIDESTIEVVNEKLQEDGTVKAEIIFSTTSAFGGKELKYNAVFAETTTLATTLKEAKDLKTAQATLKEAITKAEAVSTGKTEGEKAGDQVVGSGATLNSAIATAKTALENPTTSTAVNSATSTLNDAVTVYKAAVVAEIKAVDLTAPTGLKVGGTAVEITGNGVTLASGETLTTTSSDVTVATVSGLAVSPVAEGTTTITIQIKNAAGKVIKTGTVTVTVTAAE